MGFLPKFIIDIVFSSYIQFLRVALHKIISEHVEDTYSGNRVNKDNMVLSDHLSCTEHEGLDVSDTVSESLKQVVYDVVIKPPSRASAPCPSTFKKTSR